MLHLTVVSMKDSTQGVTMSVSNNSTPLLKQIFTVRINMIKTGFAALEYCMHSFTCPMHCRMEEYMIELTSNGCLYKMIFISITSLSYNSVLLDNGVMLNFMKKNTCTNSFNNSDLMKLVLKA